MTDFSAGSIVRLHALMALSLGFAQAHASLAPPAVPELNTPGSPSPSSLVPSPWKAAGPSLMSPRQWQAVPSEAVFGQAYAPVPSNRDPAELAIQPTRISEPPETISILGLGGGFRTGAGEQTNGVITGRVGYKLNETLALSLRPSYLFPSNNLPRTINGRRTNGRGSFQLPLTLDLFRKSFVSPYIGGGIATNTDGLGYTDPMATGGLDVNLTENITLGFNVNRVFQSNVDDRDWEFMTLLYFRL